MNECRIVKMGYNRTTQLSLVFVFVGMMFLVPVITGKALGLTIAKVGLSHEGRAIHGELSIVFEHLDAGVYVVKPFCQNGAGYNPNFCMWTTKGSGVFGGDEKGWVEVHVDARPFTIGTVKLLFSNPSSGENTCNSEGTLSNGAKVSCTIEQGNVAMATYDIQVVIGSS
jgi:hypothetical protein